MDPRKVPVGANTEQPVLPAPTHAQWLKDSAQEFNRRLENLKKAGLPAYAKENLSRYYKGAEAIAGNRLFAWVAQNPRLLAEFESDWKKGNLALSKAGALAPIAGKEQFDSMLGLWLETKHAAAEYSSKAKVPQPVRERSPRISEVPRKIGDVTICAERPGGGPGPCAIVQLSARKTSAESPLRMNADLAFAASPWLGRYKGEQPAAQHAEKGAPTLRDLHEMMKKADFDTELFTQYLMRMNSITTPEVRAKVSSIFLRLGAIVRDNPRLAFSDFVGNFVAEMNKEFGETMAFGVPKRRPAQKGGAKKPGKTGSYVPKKTSGSGKPSA